MAAKSGKNWIFPLSIGYSTNSSATLWVKNSIEIVLFLTVFKIFTLFRFPLNSKMAAKSGENWKFSPRNWILLYYPVGQKFARNYSISFSFRDIFNVLFSARWPPKVAKTLWVKNSVEITLTVSETFTIFHFPLKSSMANKSGKNGNFSPGHRILLYFSARQKFAWNHSISYRLREIFNVLFSTKIQDGCQKWQKLKFFS